MSDTPESVRSGADALYRGEYTSMGAVDAAADALARYADLLSKTCRWQHDHLCGDYYTTECGNAWEFTDGGPKDNKQVFCGYCGGRIVEVRG